MADRVVKGAAGYKTLLIWPYAVAPAIAGVLWLFLFNPSIGLVAYYLKLIGYDWNHVLNGGQAMFLVVIAAAWKQISYNFLFFLDRKSTRLNSQSLMRISYAVFCLK